MRAGREVTEVGVRERFENLKWAADARARRGDTETQCKQAGIFARAEEREGHAHAHLARRHAEVLCREENSGDGCGALAKASHDHRGVDAD